MLSRRSTILLRCPFWLLIAAWFCANTPQIASLHVILWVKNAHHFSHQQQLRHQVAAVLSGHSEEHGQAVLAAANIASTAEAETDDALKEGSKADFSVKKIVMSVEAERRLSVDRSSRQSRWREGGPLQLIAHVADVPSPPPRG